MSIRTLICKLALAVCGAVATNGAFAAQPTSVLKTDAGPIRGIGDGEMLSYLGIPYAAPPVGNLRWVPPTRPRPWAEIFDASRVGNACSQNADLGVFGAPGGSEDCLYLNVYVSRRAVNRNEKLPVFVWIHGGSLWVGAGHDYDPRRLALEGKSVVVTFNYRLGIFGFFAHPALAAEGHAVGAFGQMDQSFALDWVQRNIAAFGGDPQDVTIAGESSGGNSVLAHMLSPWSAGKFQHAVAMSGASTILRHPNFGAPRPVAAAQDVGRAFANGAGCEDQSAACLRALSTGQILAMQRPYLINQTIIDGNFIPMEAREAFRSGRFNRVSLVNGTTRDEGRFFAGFVENETGVPMTADGYPAALEAFYGRELAAKVAAEYPVDAYPSPSEAYAAAVTDYLFACPARALNRWLSPTIPIYAYEFADRTAPSYLEPTTFPLDAAHTFELAYLFPRFHGGAGRPTTLNRLQEALASEMVRYWTSVSGASRWAAWPRYDIRDEKLNRLMLPAASVAPMSRFAQEHHCDFWDATGVY